LAKTSDIVVPDLGDFSDVEVIEILVSAGDSVEKEDGLITLETDKAAMDVPSPGDGTIESISVSVGDTVSAGDTIGKLKQSGESSDDTSSTPDDGGDDENETPADDGVDDENETPADDGGDDADESPETSAPSTSDAEGSGGTQKLVVPELGDFDGVDVIEVHIAEGDTIGEEDALVTLETDKAAMDVPAVTGGTVREVLVKVGDKVSEGDALAVVESSQKESESSGARDQPDEAKDSKPEADSGRTSKSAGTSRPSGATAESEREPERRSAQAPGELPPINEAGFSRAHASPSVRKLARELGVDLPRVDGSGPKNRILHDDVKAFVKRILTGQIAAPAGAGLPKVPSVDFSKFGEIETEPLTRVQKISGPRLQASWINLPHVTQHDEADITELEEKRQELKGPAKERGIPLTPLAFIMKACVAALKEFPKVNASLSEDGESLVYKQYVHLGFAADTDQGLMVPVIRDADKMDVYELAEALRDLSAAARDGKLKAAQLQGASFTISSLGGIGGTAFTPIVNAPEVAILGVSRSRMAPVWDGEAFQPRLMLPLSFSYDHRVIDGAYAVRFTTYLSEALSDVEALLRAIP